MTVIRTVRIGARADKQLSKCPVQVQRKLHAWAMRVAEVGVEQVRKQPGYHDEPLRGSRAGQRSIRLSQQWRAIYVVREDQITFLEVIEVTPHNY